MPWQDLTGDRQKTKEYDLKFRVWDKDKVDVPQEIVKTRDFYVEM